MLNKPKTILSLLATGLITCALFGQRAEAVPIEGTIGFYGFGSVNSVGANTTVSFSNPTHILPAYGYAGDYAAVPLGNPVTFQSISYVGAGASATLTAPVTPLWQFTYDNIAYSYSLTSLSSAVTTSGALNLIGSGAAYMTGKDATAGVFSLSGSGSNLSFQFVTGSTTVPDGGSTVALLGFALVGVVGLHRKLRIITA